MRDCVLRLLLAGAVLCSSAARSGETITYGYDAKGRLVQVARAGTVNGGVNAAYSYDKSDNRTAVNVTGAAGGGGSSFSIADAVVTEGGSVNVTVTRTGDTSAAQSVSWATAGNTATSGADFTAGSGTLNFAAGDATKTVSVTTLQDTTYEGVETMFVNLSGATAGATIGDPQGLVTINDDDQQISFAINDGSVTEGGTLVLTVTKTGSTANSMTLSFATADGTAVAALDYTAASGTVTFAPTDTTKTISVATIDDSVSEADETMSVNLSGAPAGSIISDNQGVGTIVDNDPVPVPIITVSDASNTEGYPISFTITRSGATYFAVSVNFATAIGTAGAADFTAVSGTVTFAAQEVSKTVTVQTTQDTRVEGDEIFYLNLSNATGGATISDAQGIGTIVDDDVVVDPCPTCRG